MARNLGIELFDELPVSERDYTGLGGGRKSETAELVNQIIEYVNSGEVAPGKPIRIAVYDASGGAAGCAGQLKRRYGKPEAYGVKVVTRKTKNDDGTLEGYSVFVMVDPSWIVPGEKEKQDEAFRKNLEMLRLKSRERQIAKANGEEPKKRGRKKADATEAAAVA